MDSLEGGVHLKSLQKLNQKMQALLYEGEFPQVRTQMIQIRILTRVWDLVLWEKNVALLL